jgi:hypothetical protein
MLALTMILRVVGVMAHPITSIAEREVSAAPAAISDDSAGRAC